MTSLLFDKAEQSREFLFAVIESMPHGTIFADLEGRLLAVNHKARHILQLKSSSIVNRSVWEVLQRQLELSAGELDDLRRPDGRKIYRVHDRRENTVMYLSITRNELASPFQDTGGFFLALEDVTYLHIAGEQLDRRKRFSAMQEIALNMSQELKNPLGSLELYASILKRELRDSSDNYRVSLQMVRAIRTMDCILNNYMTYAGLPSPVFSEVNVEEGLAAVVGQLQSMCKEGSTMEWQPGHSCPVCIGDADMLGQLVINLGLNALESLEGNKGAIRLVSRNVRPDESDTYLELRVIDDGQGIAPEDLRKIFDPFFTTRPGKAGLGLAICHYIAEVHRGAVNVESTPGQGSEFTVLLPVEQN